jgi:phasin family protein
MARQNPFGDFDFTKMMDPSKLMGDFPKLMGDFKVPGVDVEAVVASQRRNLEALGAANQLAVEGMQAVARRQTEIFRQMMEETSQAMRDMMAAGSPEDKASRQTEMVKEAFKRAIGNMRELAEMVSKSQGEAFDVINKRVTDSLDELKSAIAKKSR